MLYKDVKIYYPERMISLGGKLWIKGVPYDFELEEKLGKNEELYVARDTIRYRAKLYGKTVDIYPFSIIEGVENPLEAIRDIARELALGCDEEQITIKPDFIKSAKKAGEVQSISTRNGNLTVIFLTDETREKHLETFKEVLKYNEGNITARKKYYIVPARNYYIEFNDVYGYVGKISTLAEEKLTSVAKFSLQKPEKTMMITKNTRPEIVYGRHITVLKAGNITLHSPQNVPDNAFLISDEPEYIQFTKNGVVLTDGIYFAREELCKVATPNYIVEKIDDGWFIFLHANSRFPSGEYFLIQGGRLIANPEVNERFVNENTLYINNYVTIENTGDTLVVNDKTLSETVKIPKSDLERIKVVIDGKTLWVPKKLMKHFLEI